MHAPHLCWESFQSYCTIHSSPTLIFLHNETPRHCRQCRFQVRVLVERIEFTIFTYSQFLLWEPDTQYHLMDTIASEEGFKKTNKPTNQQPKPEDINVWRKPDPNIQGANTETCTDRWCHMRYKGIFSTQKHTSKCNIILCILVYNGTGVWFNTWFNAVKIIHDCTTSSFYIEIRDHQKKNKYIDSQEHFDFPNTAELARFNLRFLPFMDMKRNTGLVLLTSPSSSHLQRLCLYFYNSTIAMWKKKMAILLLYKMRCPLQCCL